MDSNIKQDDLLLAADHISPYLPPELTPRQRQAVALMALGLNQASVGAVMGIAPTTVDKHCQHARASQGVKQTRDMIIPLLMEVVVENMLLKHDLSKTTGDETG